jgi:hypothetical protein
MPIVQEAAPEPEALAANPRAAPGDNMPPIEEQIAMEFREMLLSERPDFLLRMQTAIEAVGRAVVTDEETLGKAGDLEKILRACDKHVAATHQAVKEPHLARGRACDAEKNALIAKITPARAALADIMNRFMAQREAKRKAEEARVAAEQRAKQEAAELAARQAREAEEGAERAKNEEASDEDRAALEKAAEEAKDRAFDAMAAAPLAAAEPIRNDPVRSDAGSTISGRTVWNSQVEDYTKAFKAVKGDAKVREAIDAAIKRRVTAGDREIVGVKIWPTTQAIAR